MTRIYAHSFTGVFNVKRQTPPDRPQNRRKGRREGGSDRVELRWKSVEEDPMVSLLKERLTYHLRALFGDDLIELEVEHLGAGPPPSAVEALAASLVRFAYGYHELLRGQLGGVDEQEAKAALTKWVLVAVDQAVKDVLEVAFDDTGGVDEGTAAFLEQFLALVSSGLSDVLADGSSEVA